MWTVKEAGLCPSPSASVTATLLYYIKVSPSGFNQPPYSDFYFDSSTVNNFIETDLSAADVRLSSGSNTNIIST